MSADKLVLFTLHYPYCKVSETFLEPELNVLSKRFKQVIVVPWKKETEKHKTVPANVLISNLLLDFQLDKNYKGLLIKHIKHWHFFLKIYLYSVVNERNFSPYLKYAYFIYDLVNSFERAIVLKRFIVSNNLREAIFYDYWFENSTLSLSMLKDQGVIKHLFSRGHGFDVFDERWDCGVVPFRSYKLLQSKRHFAISNFNKAYFHRKVKKHLRNKIEVSYLGVRKQELFDPPKNIKHQNKYVVVSSANLFDFKQVHLMPQLLNLIDLPIIWYHFGDGPMKDDLLSNAESLSDKVEFRFMGHVAHNKLIAFFGANSIDLFISLSLKEGLPVSMMEALSFGIPLVGYRVFGIPEVINEKTGLLFDVQEKFGAMALEIRDLLLQHSIKQRELHTFFKAHFDADVNSNQLVDRMLESYES